jgi:predicted PurR-regulated permease PerM
VRAATADTVATGDSSTMRDLGASAGVLYVLLLLGLLLIILWICLPFAVFGVKRLIRQAIEEQQKTNRQLGQIGQLLEQAIEDRDVNRPTAPIPEGIERRPGIPTKSK